MVPTHDKDRPRDPGFDDPKRAFDRSRLPRDPLGSAPDVETHDVERGQHRHRPQGGHENEECEIYAVGVRRWWEWRYEGGAFGRGVGLEVGGTVSAEEEDDYVVDDCEDWREHHEVERCLSLVSAGQTCPTNGGKNSGHVLFKKKTSPRTMMEIIVEETRRQE